MENLYYYRNSMCTRKDWVWRQVQLPKSMKSILENRKKVLNQNHFADDVASSHNDDLFQCDAIKNKMTDM